MTGMINTNVYLNQLKDASESFILEGQTASDKNDMLQSKFFNRQNSGLRLLDFEKELTLTKKFQVVATFQNPDGVKQGDEHSEFIAIMEGLDLPIYIITYNIEMTQFVFANPVVTDVDIIDHSIAAREHAQFIANQIADEGRLCEQEFESMKEAFKYLIRHHEFASIEYQSFKDESLMPKGFEQHDVFLVK